MKSRLKTFAKTLACWILFAMMAFGNLVLFTFNPWGLLIYVLFSFVCLFYFLRGEIENIRGSVFCFFAGLYAAAMLINGVVFSFYPEFCGAYIESAGFFLLSIPILLYSIFCHVDIGFVLVALVVNSEIFLLFLCLWLHRKFASAALNRKLADFAGGRVCAMANKIVKYFVVIVFALLLINFCVLLISLLEEL